MFESGLWPFLLIVIRFDLVTPVCLKHLAVGDFLDLFLLLSFSFSTCFMVPKGSYLYLLSCLTFSPNCLSSLGS